MIKGKVHPETHHAHLDVFSGAGADLLVGGGGGGGGVLKPTSSSLNKVNSLL